MESCATISCGKPPNITRKSLSATEHDLRVEVAQHRLIATNYRFLRNKTTALEEFRRNLQELSTLLLGEAARAWETMSVQIETPLRECSGEILRRPVFCANLARGLACSMACCAFCRTRTSVTSGFIGTKRRCARLLIFVDYP